MKQKTTLFKSIFIVLIALLPIQLIAQYNLDYHNATGVNGGYTATLNFTNLSSCQTAVMLDGTAGVYNGVSWSAGTFTVTVNGTNIGSFASPTAGIDLAAYMPVTSVQVSSNAGTWHTTDATLHITSNSANAAPVSADVYYAVGDAASPLTATLSGTGATLNWFTSAIGDGNTTTAPTPNTGTMGVTSYWVSQSDASGCESPRTEVKVSIGYHKLQYHTSTGVVGGSTASVTLNNFSTCQDQVTLYAYGSVFTGSSWYDGTYTVIVNGSSIGNYTGWQEIDLTSYIPVTSVQLTENASTWHIVDAYVDVISLASTMPANGPTVNDVHYCQNATAVALAATLNGSGSSLEWYSTVNGDGYTTIAPTPSTATNGTTSYFVSQIDAGGCESVRSEIQVIVGPSYGTDTQAACVSFDWIDGITYTASNSVATHTIAGGSAYGCDSIVTLNLTINNPTTGIDVQTACATFDWIDGITYTASNSVATHTIAGGTVNGCDSVVTLNLTINNPSTGIDVKTACATYDWIDGITYTASNSVATHTISGGAVNGCDSVVTLNLTINNPATGTDVQTACATYDWIDGITYTTSNSVATHTISGGAENGCDSIVTLNLTINNPATGTDVQTACDSYDWIDGITYTASNATATHTISGGAANGCDSIVTLDLTIALTPVVTATDNGDGTITASGGSSYTWWNCGTNQIITGATSATFAPTQNGTYAAISSNGINCADTSDCTAILYLGLTDVTTIQFELYPNPTHSNVTVQFESATANLQITDAQGKVYFVDEISNGSSVNMEAYDNGVYFFILSTKQTKVVKRVVKN